MKYLFVIWKGWSRFVRNHKLQSAASIIGLALGLACYSASMLWLRHIESYEDFAPDGDRLYLMGNKNSPDYMGLATYNSDGYFAAYLTDKYPEIEQVARFAKHSSRLRFEADAPYNTHVDDIETREVSPGYFDLFGAKLLAGTTDLGVLSDFVAADQVVLTRTIARRLFGDDPAVGKTIYMHHGDGAPADRHAVTVVGVIEDWPHNSQFGAEIFSQAQPTIMRFGYDYRWCVMFKVRRGTDMEALEQKVHDQVLVTHGWPAMFSPHMLPLRQLRSQYPCQALQVNAEFVRLFMLLGLLVIIASVSNFLVSLVNNLQLRARNMVLHRVVGATTTRIVMLNALDTLLIMILSAVVGLLIIVICLPAFRIYTQIDTPASTILCDICGYISWILFFGIILSSIVTYIVLRTESRIILRGHQSRRLSVRLDRISMVIQLTMSIVMIACTLAMMMQIHYLTRTDALGFARRDILVLGPCTEQVEQKILQSPYTESHVSQCPTIFPVNIIRQCTVYNNKTDVGYDSLGVSVRENPLTTQMVDFWQLNLLTGTLPKPSSDEILVNEVLTKKLGLVNPVGKKIYASERIDGAEQILTYTITGMLADVYTSPPTQEPIPAIYSMRIKFSDQSSPYDYEMRYMAVRAHAGQKKQLFDSIYVWADREKADYRASHDNLADMWMLTSSYPTDVEAEYNSMINSEMLLAKLLRIIAACCIAVCLIGAYSTLSLSLQERRKEIGLRKIHGAKRQTIVTMFLRQYGVTMAIAAFIAAPVEIIIMERWLGGFIKQIPCPYWLVVAVPVALMILLVATIAHRVNTAARENPADCLKTE